MNRKFSKYSILFLFVALLFLERVMDFAAAGISPGDSAIKWVMETLLSLPAILIGISFHEFAHAKASQLLRDPTPAAYGRVSLSPLDHIDPLGFISLLFLGFGWGRPVPVNSGFYKKRRLGEIIVGVSGVAMNLLIAVVVGLFIKFLLCAAPIFCEGTMGGILLYILMKICWINLILMAFNLLPCPPLDGFTVLANVTGLREKEIYYDLYNKGMLILILLVAFNIPGKLIVGPLMYLAEILYGVLMDIPWMYLLLASPI